MPLMGLKQYGRCTVSRHSRKCVLVVVIVFLRPFDMRIKYKVSMVMMNYYGYEMIGLVELTLTY